MTILSGFAAAGEHVGLSFEVAQNAINAMAKRVAAREPVGVPRSVVLVLVMIADIGAAAEREVIEALEEST